MRLRVTLQLPARPPNPDVELNDARVLMVGYGYVAKALAPILAEQGAMVEYTSRSGDGIAFGSPEMIAAFRDADIVLISVPPSKEGSDPTLDALRSVRTSAQWIGYLSATSVYGHRGGQWAFEGEAPTPQLKRGRARAQAELAWLETYATTHVFRLAGIYGPGRSPFGRIRDGTARIVDAPDHVVNRIHVKDIVRALMASIASPSPQDIYNIADGNPASPGDVMTYAADLIGAPAPPRVSVNDPSVSPMARTFYSETKRIAITRAKARLGWEPIYSDYRDGLTATLAAETD